MTDNKFNLDTIKKSVGLKAHNFLKDIQEELVKEEHDAFKDFIKGAYRFSLEKEREIKALQKEVKEIKEAIDQASSGDWDGLSKIKIPARFFEEGTLRKHGKSLISGSSEITFLDLYIPEGEDE